MGDKNIKMISIAPKDKYNLVGIQGFLQTESLEVGKRLIVKIGDRYLNTSTIQEINETEIETEVEVKTRNSVYKFTYL